MKYAAQQYPSKSGNGSYWAIIDKHSGRDSCGCRGWVNKRPGRPRECWHTRDLLSQYGFTHSNGELSSHEAHQAKLALVKALGVAPVASIPAVAKPAVFAAKPTAAKSPVAVPSVAVLDKALATVRGKRVIEVDDDEPAPSATLAPATAAKPAWASEPKVKSEPQSLMQSVCVQAPTVAQKPAMTAADVEAVLNTPVPPKATPPKVKPMLASAMPEGQTIQNYAGPDWVGEQKFDGHRLLLVAENGSVVGWSRPGVDRPAAVRPLPPALAADAAHLPIGTYDGELYVPGGTSSDVARLDKADALRLVLFDVVEVLGVSALDRPLGQRRALLELCVKHCPDGGRVHISEQWAVAADKVAAIWAKGGEGAILKRLSSTYRSGYRSPDWVKVKKSDAAELTITGFEAGKNGPYSVAKLKHDDGRETKVKVLTNELLRDIEKDPKAYIGRRLVISHIGLTVSGQFRHPIWDHVLETAA